MRIVRTEFDKNKTLDSAVATPTCSSSSCSCCCCVASTGMLIGAVVISSSEIAHAKSKLDPEFVRQSAGANRNIITLYLATCFGIVLMLGMVTGVLPELLTAFGYPYSAGAIAWLFVTITIIASIAMVLYVEYCRIKSSLQSENITVRQKWFDNMMASTNAFLLGMGVSGLLAYVGLMIFEVIIVVGGVWSLETLTVWGVGFAIALVYVLFSYIRNFKFEPESLNSTYRIIKGTILSGIVGVVVGWGAYIVLDYLINIGTSMTDDSMQSSGASDVFVRTMLHYSIVPATTLVFLAVGRAYFVNKYRNRDFASEIAAGVNNSQGANNDKTI